MTATTIGLYHPGDSLIHRAPAGLKLVALVVAAVATHWVTSPEALGIAGLVVLTLFALARVPTPVVVAQLRPLLVLLVVLAAFQWLVAGWRTALLVVGVLLLLAALAALVTITTRTTALLDTVVRACRPLRRVGVDPDRVGLVLALGIRAVPVIAALATEIREAQLARGMRSSVRAFAVPFLVRSLRHADDLGDALAARGVDD